MTVNGRHQTGPTSLTIDCDECRMQGTSACADCVVTFLCDTGERYFSLAEYFE